MGVMDKVRKEIAEKMSGKGLDDIAKVIAAKAFEKTVEGYKDIEKKKNDELCKSLDEWYAKVEMKVDEIIAQKMGQFDSRLLKLEKKEG